MQISLFDGNHQFIIDKPIRLIELFAGIGAQAKALSRLGANFEHYRICEFDKHAVQSYNAVHGTNFTTSDIRQLAGRDLGIIETDKYCYIITYSFPCQDLSKAGKGKGMNKGGSTRSGLLWEVERLLDEIVSVGGELPQVLLMENVPDVHGEKNAQNFAKWMEKLERLGYHNYYRDLNAKDFGIPQNRDRCFMVSVLGDYYYDFPKEIPLALRLKDMLESKVDEKYYLSEKIIKSCELHKLRHQEKGNGFGWKPQDGNNIAFTVQTRAGGRPNDNFIKEPTILQQPHGYNKGAELEHCPSITTSSWESNNFLKEPQLQQVADLNHYKNDQMNRVYSGEGIAPTIETMSGGGREPKVLEPVCINSKVNGKQPSLSDRIYDSEHISTAITTAPFFMGKVTEPIIAAMRGRNPENTSDRTAGSPTEQRLETGGSVSNTLTSVQKDNMVVEPPPILWQSQNNAGYKIAYDGDGLILQRPWAVGSTVMSQCANTIRAQNSSDCGVYTNYRIRKLTPLECYRLMGFDDADFYKAKAAGVSDSQLYKQAGNSIVVNVLEEIFKKLF